MLGGARGQQLSSCLASSSRVMAHSHTHTHTHTHTHAPLFPMGALVHFVHSKSMFTTHVSMPPYCPMTPPTVLYTTECLCVSHVMPCGNKICTGTSACVVSSLSVYQPSPFKCVLCSLCFCTRLMSCLPTFLQNGRDCFLLACVEGHQEIVRELLTKDKVDQNVVNEVRN